MALPPFELGAEMATVACAVPRVAVPIVGAPGTTALTLNERLTVVAAKYLLLPAWSVLLVQVPVETKVSAPPEVIVQTPVVLDVRLTVSPDVAVVVYVGVVPKFCAPGLAKVMVWVPFGVTLFDADEALPVPTLLVAVTVKV